MSDATHTLLMARPVLPIRWLLLAALWFGVCGFHDAPADDGDPRGIHRLFRLDGRFVHNVGRVALQMTNVGETGNQDNPRRTTGNPSATNAQVVYPRGDAQPDQEHVYVVPNPYRGGTSWDLVPREEDPSGTKVTFVNLPRAKGTIRIYTLAGDLIKDVPFDGRPVPDLQYGKDPVVRAPGSAAWNLISRNGQRIVSGIYLYSIDTELEKQIGRFVIIR